MRVVGRVHGIMGGMVVAALCAVSPARAQQAATESGVAGYFDHWFDRVAAAQDSPPPWMTPLVTVYWERLPNGGHLDNYDTGKGLELIPTTTNEVILGLPAYEDRRVGKTRTTGWADDAFLLVKQRLFSENEQHGNAIVTAFLQLTAPTGGENFTGHAWVVTPTIAGGKGWGDFDIQATSGVVMPVDYFSTTGASLVTNVALQYHFAKYFWPEFEVNDTIWLSGRTRAGKDQVFLTPGIILGRFVIAGRVKAIVGGGYQFAVSPDATVRPVLNPTYNHNWVLTARLAF